MKRLDIEDQINWPNSYFLPYFTDTSAWPVPRVISLPSHKERVNLTEREQIRSAWENLSELEARVFQFERDLSPDDITLDFMVSLKLACMERTQRMNIETTTPNYVISLLFAIPHYCAPYYDRANARLKAWQSMAGLVGENKGASLEDIESVAKQCRWFTFRAINDWFLNQMIDVGIAVLRPDNQTVVVLAGSAPMD